MNAELFAKGLEKCRLLTRLRGQNVENLDDYGCPKIKMLLEKKRIVRGSALATLSDTKQGFTAERKGKLYGEWAMQHLLTFVRFLCICVYY